MSSFLRAGRILTSALLLVVVVAVRPGSSWTAGLVALAVVVLPLRQSTFLTLGCAALGGSVVFADPGGSTAADGLSAVGVVVLARCLLPSRIHTPIADELREPEPAEAAEPPRTGAQPEPDLVQAPEVPEPHAVVEQLEPFEERSVVTADAPAGAAPAAAVLVVAVAIVGWRLLRRSRRQG